MLLPSPPSSDAPATSRDEAISKPFIHRLPRELILEILLLFRPKSHNQQLLRIIIAFSTVCRLWRSIIINTPDFWTFVKLFIPKSEDPARTESHILAIDRHLRRTGSLPLDVTLSLRNVDDEAVIRILSSISAHAKFNRWRSLSLAGEIYVERERLAECGQFENLESLTVSSNFSTGLFSIIGSTAHKLAALTIAGTPDFPLHHLFSTKSLTSLTFHDAYWFEINLPTGVTHLELRHYNCLAGVRQPFDNLKHLKTDILRAGDLLTLSAEKLFPNVEFIEAGLVSVNGPPLHFPELRHLVALNSRRGSFTSLRAPKLAVLHLTGWHDVSDFKADMVARSQNRGRPHLDPTTLILDINVSPSTIKDILAVYTSLQQLRFYFRTNWLYLDLIEDTLMAEEVGEWRYCSQLAELEITLDRVQKEKEGWPAVAERLIEVRRNAPLHIVRINWSCGTYAVYTDHSTVS
jgi:hypothetical protein